MIQDYISAGYPAVAIQTVEEERLVAFLANEYNDRQIWGISGTGALRDLRKGADVDERAGYVGAFKKLANYRHRTILVVYDLQFAIHQPGGYRPLRQVLPACKASGHVIVLVGPSFKMPEEISHEVPVVSWQLPTRAQLSEALGVCEDSVNKKAENRDSILDAGAGLTLSEAEGAFALAWKKESKSFDKSQVERVKMGLIRQSGALQLEAPRPMSDVGGLANVRKYLTEEVAPSIGDPEVIIKGILLVGVPGTGKSLLARVMGSVLGWPVIRLNLAAVKGSLVGQSEAQLRNALACVDAVAPAIVWLDELEKAVGGYASSANTDSGVTLSIVGELLTWMQEHTSKVIVAATCNDHMKLPAEMTRAGRMDSMWFVDLPTEEEREDIFRVHLVKYKLPANYAGVLAGMSEGWTGAEIEGCVRSIARRVRGNMKADAAIATCVAQVVPLSRSRQTEIDRLRQWGRECCLQANSQAENQGQKPARRLNN